MGKTVRYQIDHIDLTAGEVLTRITRGLAEMGGHGGEGFEGHMGFILEIPVERAETFEEAAKRAGIRLERTNAT